MATAVSVIVGLGLVEILGSTVEMAAKVPLKQARPRLTNPVDLAAARLLRPLSRKALAECLDAVRSAAGEDTGSRVRRAVRRVCQTRA